VIDIAEPVFAEADAFVHPRLADGRPWLPSARECEIITAPNRIDRRIQRGGQV